jgi:hypothetical protein
MPAKNVQGIPRTAKEAKDRGYKKAAKVKHAELSAEEKKKWALFKPGARHTVCYYDPNTGEYDDCHEEG